MDLSTCTVVARAGDVRIESPYPFNGLHIRGTNSRTCHLTTLSLLDLDAYEKTRIGGEGGALEAENYSIDVIVHTKKTFATLTKKMANVALLLLFASKWDLAKGRLSSRTR